MELDEIVKVCLDAAVELNSIRRKEKSTKENLTRLGSELKRKIDSSRSGFIYDRVLGLALVSCSNEQITNPSPSSIYINTQEIYGLIQRADELSRGDGILLHKFLINYSVYAKQQIEELEERKSKRTHSL